MSQIGYMFLGAGLGAYANGMFHLMTHAFFKALLFMAAGIVIHALVGEQDIRKMGGLRRALPFTYVATLIGALALVGVPPFAGFFSKDSILASALTHGWYGQILWTAGLVGAFLTGLYTFRMILLVFGGEQSDFVKQNLFGAHAPSSQHSHELGPSEPGDEPAATHADAPGRGHRGEGPLTMVAPVAVLALLSVIGGWIQFADLWMPITDWLHPVVEPLTEATRLQEGVTSVAAVIFGLAGVGTAWWIYGARLAGTPDLPRVQAALERKLYFDEAYDWLFYRPAVFVSRLWGALIEGPLIGGSVTGVARGTGGLGARVRGLQTGLVRSYALAIAGSLAVLAVVFVSIR